MKLKILSLTMALLMCLLPVTSLAIDNGYNTINPQNTPVTAEQDDIAIMGEAGKETTGAPALKAASSTSGYTTTKRSGNTFYHRNTDITGTQIIPVIDVSKHQGTINFTKVKNDGVKGVILRCAYQGYSDGSLYKDVKFEEYYKNAKAAGLKIGVYIYTEAISETEAKTQANFVKSLIKGKTITLPVVFDYENCGNRVGRNGISRSKGTQISLAFLNNIKSAGYEAMLYSGMAFNNSHNNIATVRGKGFSIWLARYNKWPYNASADVGKGYYNGKIDAWQSSGGSGMNCYVAGISGAVDFDWWYDPITVKVNKTSASISKGATATISASSATKHFGAYSESYFWSTSNKAVATVSGGKITGVAPGKATITVKGAKSAKSATCAVTVTAPASILPQPSATTLKGSLSGTTAKLTWSASSNATGYEVWERATHKGKETLLGTVATTSYNRVVAQGCEKYFRVRPVNVKGNERTNGAFSNLLTITSAPSKAVSAKTTSAVNLVNAGGTKLTAVPKGKVCKILAYNGDSYKVTYSGKIGYIKKSSANIYASAPKAKVKSATAKQIVLSWEGSGSFAIYRSEAYDGKYTKIGAATAKTYTDKKVTKNHEYFYKVCAITNVSNFPKGTAYSGIVSSFAKAKQGTVVSTKAVKKNSYIRKRPGTTWKSIGHIPKGKKAKILGTSKDKDGDKWYKVKYGKLTGYTYISLFK